MINELHNIQFPIDLDFCNQDCFTYKMNSSKGNLDSYLPFPVAIQADKDGYKVGYILVRATTCTGANFFMPFKKSYKGGNWLFIKENTYEAFYKEFCNKFSHVNMDISEYIQVCSTPIYMDYVTRFLAYPGEKGALYNSEEELKYILSYCSKRLRYRIFNESPTSKSNEESFARMKEKIIYLHDKFEIKKQ